MADRGLFGTIEDTMSSPLWLGGAALLSGEGMGGAMRGMHMGNQFKQQRRQQDEEEALRQRFEGLVNDPQKLQGVNPAVLELARAAGFRQGFPMLADAANVDPLKRDLMQAQINKLQQEASGQGPEEFGKAGAVFQGADGRFYTVQFGARGTRNIVPVEAPGMPAQTGQPTAPSVPLAPAQGVTTVDEGTGTRVIQRSTGQDVRTIQKDLAGAEADKVRGRNQAELEASFPKARASVASANAKSDLVLQKIQQARPLVSNWSVGFGSVLKNWPATQARNLKEVVNTIIANMGFDELQEMRANSPTGGALGQVAVQELEMLQKTRTSLEQAQTVDQFNQALSELEAFIKGSKQRREQAFAASYGDVGAAAARRTGSFSPGAAGGNSGGWSMQRID